MAMGAVLTAEEMRNGKCSICMVHCTRYSHLITSGAKELIQPHRIQKFWPGDEVGDVEVPDQITRILCVTG